VLEKINVKGRDLVISYSTPEIQLEWKKAFTAIGAIFHGDTGSNVKGDKGFLGLRTTLTHQLGKGDKTLRPTLFDSKSDTVEHKTGMLIPVNAPVNINTLKTLNQQLEKEKKILEKDILTREEETNKLRDNLYKMEKERLESASQIEELTRQLGLLTEQFKKLRSEVDSQKPVTEKIERPRKRSVAEILSDMNRTPSKDVELMDMDTPNNQTDAEKVQLLGVETIEVLK
jgi:hypothetical protein